MSDGPPTPPFRRGLTTAREYLTHWFAAGVILTLTGFTPDHWVGRLFHALKLDRLRDALPGVDYRLLVVGAGVAVSTCALIFQNRAGRKAQRAAALVPTAASIPGAAPAERPDDVTHQPSIAVLPFVNLSGDREQEYFADGMTEDIITGLSCDSRLFVIARNSTFAYKGRSPDIRAVGKELGVRYVVEGSIRPVGERLRISVQLIETASGTHVWADKIDRPKVEIFAVMDEVVDGLVMALCSNLGVAESSRTRRQRPENLQAWALCVQAEAVYSLQPETRTVLEAETLARRAAEIEPGYAVSWAFLAYMAAMRIGWGMSDNLARDSEETLALVNKALHLTLNDPIVLGYCGFAAVFAGAAPQAIDYLERSLALNPNSSFSRCAYGAALWANARPDDGIAQLLLFLRRSPKDPYIGNAHVFLAWCYLALNDFQQAEQAARDCIKHFPGFAFGYLGLAMSLVARGHDAEAQEQMQHVQRLEPAWTRRYMEDLWCHVIQNRAQAEAWTALMRQAWRD